MLCDNNASPLMPRQQPNSTRPIVQQLDGIITVIRRPGDGICLATPTRRRAPAPRHHRRHRVRWWCPRWVASCARRAHRATCTRPTWRHGGDPRRLAGAGASPHRSERDCVWTEVGTWKKKKKRRCVGDRVRTVGWSRTRAVRRPSAFPAAMFLSLSSRKS